MTDTKDLLVEIGTEELPPTALKNLSDCFSTEIINQLEKANLKFGEYQSFATPRRLAIVINDLETKQQDKNIDRKGPALQAAYDKEGNPTKAAEGFARSCGVTVAELEKIETDKGTWLSYKICEKGKESAEIIPQIIQTSLDKLPIPKRMRWGDLDAQFVRPVHWIIVLFGENVINTNILSVNSDNKTFGHRFHFNKKLVINNPNDYETVLEEEGYVIPSFDKRKKIIRAQVNELAKSQQATAIIDEDLLNEVTGMIEQPQAILGSFDHEFLEVPPEALISAMKKHQKYFHLVDQDNKLLPSFITISNINSSDPIQVKEGNERVIRPRLSDAAFFWNQDLKISLESRVNSLKSVVFQNKLGTLFDKTNRVVNLSDIVAKKLGFNQDQAKRAALLAKTDLMTNMINEFPDLQGIMGRYYAEKNNETTSVAIALDEQYLPRFSGDMVAQNEIGQCLAIAERIDTLCGIFAIGLIPTGDKDPFALRRASLGLLRTIIENNLDLDLGELLSSAAKQFESTIKAEESSEMILNFINERLKSYLLEKGFGIDEFESIAALKINHPNDFVKRIEAVKAFKKLPEAENLSAANKRIGNILKKVDKENISVVDDNLFEEQEERSLYNEINKISDTINSHNKNKNYTKILQELAVLKDSIDNFFDNVMVMSDNENLKNNRIALLAKVRSHFIQVADLSYLS